MVWACVIRKKSEAIRTVIEMSVERKRERPKIRCWIRLKMICKLPVWWCGKLCPGGLRDGWLTPNSWKEARKKKKN